MPAFFATALLLSLAFSLAIAFSSDRARRRLKVLLVLSLLSAWIAFGLRLREVAERTASTVITPGGPRQPHLEPSTKREALELLGSHGGPALLVTVLAWLALRATRPGRRRPRPQEPG